MAARPPLIKNPFEHLFEYESFLNILRYYVDLNCFVIQPDPGDGSQGWLAVHYNHRPASLFDWQKKYGYVFNWDKLTDLTFEKSHAPGAPILLDAAGFRDIIMPIRRGKKRLGTILSGAFADRELTYTHLMDSWRFLSGREASPENAEFRRFVRVMLETPVLEGPTLQAYREALELFARVLAHDEYQGATRRLQELSTGIFSKQFPHSYWMDWALGLPTRQATPLWNRTIEKTDWLQRDFGIRRVPTTVITAIPLNTQGRKRDPIEEMLRVYRFQRRSFHFARTLPETSGGKLENYGSVFITSPDSSRSRPQRRRQIMETAERIHRFAVEELGGPALVGVGESVVPGETLTESYRQAVLALHLGRGSGKKIVALGPLKSERPDGALEIMRLLGELEGCIEDKALSGLESVLDGFLQQVLTLSMQDPEGVRWHLQYALMQLRKTVRKRPELGSRAASQLHEQLVISLEKAGTIQEMVDGFKEAVEKILRLTQGADELRAAYTIEEVRERLDENFREPLQLARLAKMVGVSVSTLSRRFRKETGVGLEAYLQNLRLLEAKRLLKTGSLPVAQVAHECGFKPGSHFAKFFRRKTRLSPQEFRENS